MAYLSTIEILALIVIAASLIKTIIILINKDSWVEFAKTIYSKPYITKSIFLILSLVTLYFLITSGITITQILAVALFIILFMGIALSEYASSFLKIADKMTLSQIIQKHGLYILLWLTLIAWSLWEILG